MVRDVLFQMELRLVAVGWRVWISLVVSVGLFDLEFGVVVVE